MTQYWYMIIADILLTLVSIIFGLMLRLEIFNPGNSLFNYYFRSIWPFTVLAIIIRPAFLYYAGIYRRIWRYATTRDFVMLIGSVVAGSIILFIVTQVCFNSLSDPCFSQIVIRYGRDYQCYASWRSQSSHKSVTTLSRGY